jgi:hypothetical protein
MTCECIDSPIKSSIYSADMQTDEKYADWRPSWITGIKGEH